MAHLFDSSYLGKFFERVDLLFISVCCYR